MEATSTLPPDVRAPVLLPDRKTADVLVKSYFVNVSLSVPSLFLFFFGPTYDSQGIWHRTGHSRMICAVCDLES